MASGWNRPSSNQPTVKKGGAKAPSKAKGIVAGLVTVCALGGLCLWMFSGGDDAPKAKSDKERGLIKDSGKRYKKVDEISKIKPRKKYDTVPKSVDEAMARVEESQEPLKIKPYKGVIPKRERIFKTGPEQLLSWLCHTEPGDMPIPIPPITGEDLDNIVGILISANKVVEGDDEKTANAKQMVDAAKKEMLAYLKEGGDPNDFMKYYYNELRKAFEKRNCAIEMYEELQDEDPSMAKEFAKKVNAQFDAEGIKRLPGTSALEDGGVGGAEASAAPAVP